MYILWAHGSRAFRESIMNTQTRGFYRASQAIALAICLIVGVPASAQVFTANAVGNDIVVTVGFGLSGNQCCRGSALDNPTASGIGASCSIPCGPPITQIFSCNWVGTHLVTACWSDDH